MKEKLKGNQTAVLVSVQLRNQNDDNHQDSLHELERLVQTLGLEVVGYVTQKRSNPSPSTYIGSGKLKQIAAYTGGPGFVRGFSGKNNQSVEDEAELGEENNGAEENAAASVRQASVMVIDAEISPTQLKNLEEACGVEVLDRTGVILEIFSRHAHSPEAKMQIEIAKLKYLAPRLRASSIGADRQGGGIGAKGAGETSHELDRRRIRDRVVELQTQLEAMHTNQDRRRQRRRENPGAALVGYTNAGKSSLMRALTGSEVLVEDKLFATLDTKVRALQPPSVPQVLISDTVGFIKKLPHDLVASFQTTLDEALGAKILLLTVDAADPTFRSQLEVTEGVLKDIGADDIPRLLVMNKIDRLDQETLQKLREEFPEGIFITTRSPADIKALRQKILSYFEQSMVEREVYLTFPQGNFLGDIRKKMAVLEEKYEDTRIMLRLKAEPEEFLWLEKLLQGKE